MAEDRRPPLPSFASQTSVSDTLHSDPFGDRPHGYSLTDPAPSAYSSTVSLPQEFGTGQGNYEDDDEVEKVPLTSSQGMSGSLYPPA